jgi:ATP-binding cassette, subfamily B, bacterial
LAKDINVMSDKIDIYMRSEKLWNEERYNMITNMSHDLKTPIMSIDGYIHLIKNRKYTDEKEYDTYCEIIARKSEELNNAINQLFELSKLNSDGFSSFFKTTSFIRVKVFEKLLKLPISYSETHHSGDTLSRLNNDIRTMQEAYGWSFRMILVRLLSGFSSAFVMFLLDPRVSFLLITIGLLSVLISAGQTKEVRSMNDAVQKSMGGYTENLANIIGGFMTMKSMGFETEMMKKASTANREILDNNLRLSKKNAAMESRNFLFGSINFVGVVILASYLALRGVSSLGSVVSMVYLLGNVNNMFSEINGMLLRMQSSLAGAKRVTELLDAEAEPEVVDTEGSKNRDMIVLEDIIFAYTEDSGTLKEINLTIKKGQVAALVGPSGGGSLCK